MSATTVPQGFKALPLSITQLSLSAVLRCGQSFRWASFPLVPPDQSIPPACNDIPTTPTDEYRFCLNDRVVCLRQSDDFLFYRSVFASSPASKSDFGTAGSALTREREDEKKELETLAFIRDYFQLEVDLLTLYDAWSASDPVFHNLRGRFKGIRMLRQDPWECLISFICSSNNNISRISKMVQNLCTYFSPPLLSLSDPDPVLIPSETSQSLLSPPPTPSPMLSLPAPVTLPDTAGRNIKYCPFPPPSFLSSPNTSQKLRALGFGYRADFIQKTASMLLNTYGSDEGVFAFLAGLREKETEEARVELMKCHGVGRKVADCVLLMSLDKREVIPVDTHVYQIALKHYGLRGSSNKGGKTPMSPKLYDEVNGRLGKIWGSYAGWAHTVLFTADLKAFSTYGLPSPTPSFTPSVSPVKTSRPSKFSTRASPLTLSDSRPLSSSRKKRKLAHDVGLTGTPVTPNVDISESTVAEEDSQLPACGTLADRVKRRRRVTVTSTSYIVKEW